MFHAWSDDEVRDDTLLPIGPDFVHEWTARSRVSRSSRTRSQEAHAAAKAFRSTVAKLVSTVRPSAFRGAGG
jgi:hypothetical protein